MMSKPKEGLRRSKRLKEKHPQENLTCSAIKEHPLLNGLILENVFGYLKNEKNETTLADYRTVCKVWDQEIVKLLRKDTQIDLCKILASYPTGLGWTASPQNSDVRFTYKAPYSEVRSFQNILVTAKVCDNFKNANWIKWFQLMGSQIKRLQFSSPFTCFCQNKFLERILKEWCPNLECLELRDIKCVDSLFLMSSFLQNSTTFLCKNLKDLRIIIDGGEEQYSLCPDRDSTYANVHVLDINIRKLCLKFSTWKLVNFIYERSVDSNNGIRFPEIVNTSGKKVKLQVPLVQNEGLPDLSTYFVDHLKPTDGGIIGQIMKEINIEKIMIHGLNELSQSQDFVTFLHIRSNKWRSSLKYLELNEFLSKSIKELHVIAQVKFPLTVIQLGGVHSTKDNGEMTKFLEYFSDTLEHLEISGSSVREDVREEPCELIIPVLRKLKKFVHGNIESCSLSAENLFVNAPNLETCYLEGRMSEDSTFGRFFETTTTLSCNKMKDLKIAAPIFGLHAKLILKWFPNLNKMELGFRFFGVCAYGFFEQLEMSKVEHLKIAFLSYQTYWGKALDQCKTAVPWKTGNIKKLKSLELNNLTDFQCHLTTKLFPKGKLKLNLTSLKLINLRMLENKKEELLNGLSHIPSVEMVN